jgi:gliding motility-associated-like protein
MLKNHRFLLLHLLLLPVTFRVDGQPAVPDTVCAGQTIHYFVEGDHGSTYSWSIDGELQPGYTNSQFEYTWKTDNKYLLEVQEYSAEGCPGPVRSEVVFVIGCPVPPGVYLSISRAFSPNGDLVNDVWNIGNTGFYPKLEITIFNRWGQLVWKSARGYPVPWDGRSNGASLPIDSYHYVIDLHNGSKPIIGTITIVR